MRRAWFTFEKGVAACFARAEKRAERLGEGGLLLMIQVKVIVLGASYMFDGNP